MRIILLLSATLLVAACLKTELPPLWEEEIEQNSYSRSVIQRWLVDQGLRELYWHDSKLYTKPEINHLVDEELSK